MRPRPLTRLLEPTRLEAMRDVSTPRPVSPKSERNSSLGATLRQFRGAFFGIGLFSALINLLALTGSIFMLQVYDRVLPSKSVPTLVGLILIVVGLCAFQAVLDLVRTRLLVRIGHSFDAALTKRVYTAVVKLPLKAPRGPEGLQPVRDLDVIRNFLTSSGPGALFDLPWIPFYLALCFAFHFYIGLTATVGALLIVGITVLTEVYSRSPIGDTARFGAARNAFAELSRRNSEVLHALGMTGRMGARWQEANEKYSGAQQRTTDVTGGLGSVAKVLRLLLQSMVLAVGAYLVIEQQATAGIIIAGSIISGRALAPADTAIANWKGFVAARQGWNRLGGLLKLLPDEDEVLQLPKPTEGLSVENVAVVPPSTKSTVVQGVSFELRAGEALGIIGPSASGKSSLVRAILGVWPAAFGTVRIDGAELDQWSRDALGRHLGYLPQEVSLCDGTVAENIARFEKGASPEAIIAAAKTAGVHDLILSLPRGYGTEIGEAGEVLSAGQRQRIGLARALFGDPFLVVLDEPNSNLDMEGDLALTKAIQAICARNGIVIVIAHRPSVLLAVDYILALQNGRPRAFGKREEMLAPLSVIPSGPSAPNHSDQRVVA